MTEPILDALRGVYTMTGSRAPAPIRNERMMGCDVVIQVVGGPPGLLDDLVEAASRCEQLWSRFRPDSDISRLNASEGPVLVHPDTAALIETMIRAFRETRGTFNPTLLPRVIAAGYDTSIAPETLGVPASPLKDSTVFTSLDGIELAPGQVELPTGMTLDPGGIAKGYTADLIVGLARQAGAFGAMAIFGGDVRVTGEAPAGGPWVIGVEDVFSPDRHAAVVRLVDGGIATSGQHKRRFRGGSTHHLIDPLTGLSAVSDVQAVTVIAGTGAQAEVLTKAAFSWKADEYLDWIPTMNAAARLTFTDGRIQESTSWGTFL